MEEKKEGEKREGEKREGEEKEEEKKEEDKEEKKKEEEKEEEEKGEIKEKGKEKEKEKKEQMGLLIQIWNPKTRHIKKTLHHAKINRDESNQILRPPKMAYSPLFPYLVGFIHPFVYTSTHYYFRSKRFIY